MRPARATAILALLVVAACGRAAVPSTQPTPSASPPASTAVELKYDLVARLGPPAYCDPDSYPIAREVTDAEVEQRIATIAESDPDTYRGILAHHGFGGILTAAQARTVYQDYKVLRTVVLARQGDAYTFSYAARAGQQATAATRYEGRITAAGAITIDSQTPTRLMCPICLAKGTLIATPDGPVPVQMVRPGMLVYSADAQGRRLIEPVVQVGSTEAPPWHQLEVVALSDGRLLSASPGHPTADGRRLEQLAVGDTLDGARVTELQLVDYGSGRTYDLLPAGPTGEYWADGVLLGSTLRPTLVG